MPTRPESCGDSVCLKAPPHCDRRRTFSSAALTAGYTLAQVGVLLGHASPQTTAGYAYLMPQPAAKAVDVIAGKLAEMMAPAQSDAANDTQAA